MEIKITINVGGNDPIEVKVDVPEKGETKVRKERTDISEYAKWFDNVSIGWTKNPELNKLFLQQQQKFCNERLKRNGYLFLNEVYDCLGIVKTRAGQCVGWIYDERNPIGDNYVDFDLFADRNSDFINGLTDRVLLDFNVDGDILKYL